MCTHLHWDHVGWNTRLENGKWVPTFPNAKYVMSRTDHDHCAERSRVTAKPCVPRTLANEDLADAIAHEISEGASPPARR